MEGGKRLKERVKQKKELIPKREYIDNNVIFKECRQQTELHEKSMTQWLIKK